MGGGAGPACRGPVRAQSPGPQTRCVTCQLAGGGACGRDAGTEPGPGSRTLGGTRTSGGGAGPASWGEARVQNPVDKNRAVPASEGRSCTVGVGSAQSPGSKCRAGPRAGGRGAGSAGRWSLKPKPAKNSAGPEGWAQLPGASLGLLK